MTSPVYHRSLRHEYELYVEREIEAYKESVPRSVLLSIGDEAVRSLAAAPQFALTELLLWEEVDRIIRLRLGIPSFQAWRRRRLRRLAAYRRPEHWGFDADTPIVRSAIGQSEARVLVMGATTEGSALYLAAHGCEVTTVEPSDDAVERVMAAAFDAGITGRVHGLVANPGSFAPDAPLTAVVCTAAAFAGLSLAERTQAITTLQSATLDGGVHLVQTIVAGHASLTLEELAERYHGWSMSVTPADSGPTLIARKGAAEVS
ncbi:MAG TPA: hypothetical protein VHQ45_09920 [Gemmatimonadaceae bacterium]|jgi:hypothetical protein|nr:hypothetical protein [Gemmatimonadaceae bacterium]